MWKVFKVNKKDSAKARVNCCSTLSRFKQTLHLVWVLLWSFFEKQANFCCGIWSILISITSQIPNAANHAIAKNSCKRFSLTLSFLENNKVQKQTLTEKFYLAFSTSFASGKDFSRSYLTFDISNNTNFFGTIKKTVNLYLPMLIET